MSSDCSQSSSSLDYLVPTPSTSTNFVDEALATSGDDKESDSPPPVPWRTGADPLPHRDVGYVGHTNWLADHPPAYERPRIRVRRRVRIRRKRYVVDEFGISRDFFLIIALCFVLACLLIVSLRPIALEILWYIDDS
ncbi:hypothetical protein GGX14DRAFT_574291 [Mycena pura]|uniref:Uncharacterized protein n=1 Tax=Mycena pura TaxID=153505 RepID=A0AAD6Y1W9_9AGAR|nr:hypothetical protein GGX14DRAFT_574291 [Mycena pura]